MKRCSKTPNFSFAVMKAQWDVCGRRILLDDNTGSGAVMHWQIRFQCVGV